MCNTIDYSERLFFVVTEENHNTTINEFCEAIFYSSITGSTKQKEKDKQNTNLHHNNHDALVNMLSSFPRPFTIVQEPYHIDRSFRDTYYMYFSNQHFNIARYSRRLSFFKGELDIDDFFSNNPETDKLLKNNFMGICVINPLITGAIGRTLINPKYIIKSDFPVYMRLTEFKLHIYGKILYVDAFPYRMQDAQTICCAEVTLLNILEYYSNSFGDYKIVLPNDIISSKQNHHHERVLPTKGMTYPMLTKVLSEFGFSPRLYSLSAMHKFEFSKVSRDDEIKRWLHYYIESGIPVAVNLSPMSHTDSGHSVVCIGHGPKKEDLMKKALNNKWIPWSSKDNCHPIINSADFYEDYVVVDDNQPVYQVKKFDNLSSYLDMKVSDISVPLYKRMFLDAPDASAVLLSLLHHEQYGISNWTKDFLKPQEDVVMRLFMASSHNLKNYRVQTSTDIAVQKIYATLPMPRFVWVCELYRVEDYDELKAFGEIIMDATSTYNSGANGLIMMHYLNQITLRDPKQKDGNFDEMISVDSKELFPGYRHNLSEIN